MGPHQVRARRPRDTRLASRAPRLEPTMPHVAQAGADRSVRLRPPAPRQRSDLQRARGLRAARECRAAVGRGSGGGLALLEGGVCGC
jgi:IS5 family transposase